MISVSEMSMVSPEPQQINAQQQFESQTELKLDTTVPIQHQTKSIMVDPVDVNEALTISLQSKKSIPLNMIDVKNEFVDNLDKMDNNEIREERNPWQSSRPSIPREDDRSENDSHDSLPAHLTSRSSHKLVPPPPPPPPIPQQSSKSKPGPIQPPSSLDSHYAHQRDLSESIQDGENEIEDMVFDVEYDQILQKPRTSRASSRSSFRGRVSRGPSLDKLNEHQKRTVIVSNDKAEAEEEDEDEDEEKDSENTDSSDSYDTHTPSETTGTNSDEQLQDSPNTDDTTIIYNNNGHPCSG
eukprot:CAMPEP_0201596566 /NCGR_PEP_ID=MMETSP0190_2-20130828/193225_1 /ASSEMBLY_ACC=CAM_ASM_000263 /TAXON_ID=37353 /ORGANISM="Rosalina sp." /LENGTH=296 /DNA_ID=CAMNT_0048056991 /DNA_START=575 /DNA_END=1465 /DNA_ORIENTATION=-